ncbi:tyrosine-type recombinase/integrase [Microbulbifer sp. OS29]|uniref:Tyrosine-type recombinase/integrase n=1 Tax=Microbulbifer okhotskensis TaxID=2926617 RepID=A0A9X2J7F1_9GAMM|nr:tyrosine-type recombinase/integrase [Microbulbifer okhotskensis]MCO1336509.1 tyrosine-type recombinase/integrase [Microbulbifer okhotskensis]
MPRWVEVYPRGYRVKIRSQGAWHLCNPDATRAEVWAAYERWESDQYGKVFTISDLIDLYFASPQFTKELKPQTQKDYFRYAKKIRTVFGQAKPDTIASPVIQMYMDTRGQQFPTAANRERTFLSIIFRWGKARGFVSIEDPTKVVKPLKEKQGGRYVEDSEYLAFYTWLESKGHTAHAAAMEIAYLCGARQQDVLALKRQDITEEGLLICQQKTGKKQLKLWTERLHDAVELALKSNTRSKSQCMHLIRGRTGQRYTRDGFNSTWSREQKAATEAGTLPARFRFHDLKIKGISDFEGDKQEFSGHKTRSMMERYNHTADKVVSLNKARIKGRKDTPKDTG